MSSRPSRWELTEPAEPEVVPEHDLVGALEAVLLVVDAPGHRGRAGDGGRVTARPGCGNC